MNIITRAYIRGKDDQGVRELLSQHFAATQHPYYTTDPSNWERICANTDQPNIQLWEDRQRSRITGVVLYNENKGEFSALIHPEYREIEEQQY